MRHCKQRGRLNRQTSWRRATLKSLSNDLLKFQRIETTAAKAKALRSYVEPLITLAKNNPKSVDARKKAFQKLSNRDIVKSLFDDLAPLYKNVQGGYTRIMLSGSRKGDGVSLAVIELTKRTITDEKLLKLQEKKKEKLPKKVPKKAKKEKVQKAEGEAKEAEKEEKHPEVNIEGKGKHTPTEAEKEKAKTEEKKRSKIGLFKRFQRKSMG